MYNTILKIEKQLIENKDLLEIHENILEYSESIELIESINFNNNFLINQLEKIINSEKTINNKEYYNYFIMYFYYKYEIILNDQIYNIIDELENFNKEYIKNYYLIMNYDLLNNNDYSEIYIINHIIDYYNDILEINKNIQQYIDYKDIIDDEKINNCLIELKNSENNIYTEIINYNCIDYNNLFIDISILNL